MITLTTSKKLQIVLGGAATTNQLQWEAHYIDTTGDTVGNADGVTNDGTDVDMVAAPAADNRLIYSVSVYNADTIEATVTIKTDASGTERILVSKALAAGQTLQYEDKQGWSVAFASSGSGVSDHGDLTGLSGDDHSQYLLANGTRAGASTQAQDFGTNGIKADVVAESTADNGIAIDGLTVKDAGFALGSDADGDIYYRSSGALARLAKGTADQVLTMNAGATAPEWADNSGGTAVTDIAEIRDQIAYLHFRDDAGYNPVPGGFFDSFTDQTGVDDAASTNESYDAAGDYYETSETAGAVIDSYSEANADSSVGLYSSSMIATGQSFTLGSTKTVGSAKFYLAKTGSPTGSITVSLYAATGTVGVDAYPTGAALGTSGAINASTLTGTDTLVEFTFATPVELTSGDYCVVIAYGDGDVSNAVYVQRDGSSPSHAGNRFNYTDGVGWTSNDNTRDTVFYLYEPATTNNMTLISETVSESAAPDIGRAYLFLEEVDTITINTDVKAYVTCDDGTTWDEVTLAHVLTISIGGVTLKMYAGDETYSTTGTTMGMKVVTANNKHIRLHDWGVAWRDS